jgi:tight adherence protein B
MTIAWLAGAAALLLWPLDLRAARLRRLSLGGRLAPVAKTVSPIRFQVPTTLPPAAAPLAAMVGGLIVLLASARPLGRPAACAFALAALVVLGVGLTLLRNGLRRRAAVVVEVELALAVGLMRAELEAGAGPGAALAAGSTAGALGRQIARRLDNAFDRPSENPTDEGDRTPEEVDRVVLAWRLSAGTGAPLADVLARVRADLTDRAATRRDVAAALAGPRSSAVLLALLPVLGIGMGAAIGAHPLQVLLGTDGGRWLLCAGVVLDALGLLWTDRLIARAQRP